MPTKILTKRIARGKSLPQTKLSDNNIKGILGALNEGFDQKVLAQIYQCSKSHINRIKNKKRRVVLGSYPGLAANDVPPQGVGNNPD